MAGSSRVPSVGFPCRLWELRPPGPSASAFEDCAGPSKIARRCRRSQRPRACNLRPLSCHRPLNHADPGFGQYRRGYRAGHVVRIAAVDDRQRLVQHRIGLERRRCRTDADGRCSSLRHLRLLPCRLISVYVAVRPVYVSVRGDIAPPPVLLPLVAVTVSVPGLNAPMV